MKTKAQTQPQKPEDRILWQSPDGAVIVRRRVGTAMRWPPHAAPIITLDVRPGAGTRIRPLRNGRIDLCLEHAAIRALIAGLNEADRKVDYGVPPHVCGKPASRKEKFDRINAWRWAEKRQKA